MAALKKCDGQKRSQLGHSSSKQQKMLVAELPQAIESDCISVWQGLSLVSMETLNISLDLEAQNPPEHIHQT